MLAGTNLDLMQSTSMAIGVQRKNEMKPITILVGGNNDHLHSRRLLSRLRGSTRAEDAVWPAIKGSGVHGRYNRFVERRRIPEINAQVSVWVVSGLCTPSG